MDWTLIALGILSVGVMIESLLLVGTIAFIRHQDRKIGVLLSNYKADLEMVLLHAHKFDEFIQQTEEAMKQETVDPEQTVYIK